MKKNIALSLLLECYGGLLTDRQKKALDMYYNMDFSLSEIAENIGVTRQCARNFIKRGEAHLLEFEKKTGLYKRTRLILSETEKILSETENLSQKSKDELERIEKSIKKRLSAISCGMET
jgi:predicted DNA-binding protein YlxM (UPF0122 family)